MRLVVLLKAYVRSHTRTLPSGRTVTIPAYFTKVVPKGEAAKPGRQRALKQAPPPGVHRGLTPEQLAHRLVRHVQEGTLTHEEAEANVAHLERRAHAGHGLEHGHGPAWTAEHVHQFVGHARGGLQAHREAQARQKQAAETRQPSPMASGEEAERYAEAYRKVKEGRERARREEAERYAEAYRQAKERREQAAKKEEPTPRGAAEQERQKAEKQEAEEQQRQAAWKKRLAEAQEKAAATQKEWRQKIEQQREELRQMRRYVGIEPVPPPSDQSKQAQPPQGEPPRPAQGITQQERQADWDRRMRERQQAEREKPQGQTAPQPPRRTRGQRHRAQVQAVLEGRQAVGKSLPLVVLGAFWRRAS